MFCVICSAHPHLDPNPLTCGECPEMLINPLFLERNQRRWPEVMRVDRGGARCQHSAFAGLLKQVEPQVLEYTELVYLDFVLFSWGVWTPNLLLERFS